MRRNVRAGILLTAILSLGAGLLAFSSPATPAQTAELHVMVSDGMKPVIEDMTPQIEHATGRKLVAEFNSSKNLREKIKGGESFDAAILTSDVLDDLIQQGNIASASRVDIFRTGMGVGVRAGAPKPDISTPDALKSVLLKAKSISFNPTAPAPRTRTIFFRVWESQTQSNPS